MVRFTLLALLLALVSGCTIRGSVRIESLDGSRALSPSLPTIACVKSDTNTVDVYLTDLERDDLLPGAPLTDVTGSIVHVHLFLRPRAGRTPIEREASTASVRHVILTGGEIGVYGGGGFLKPAWTLDTDTFKASMRRASVELTRSTPGFVDRLGPSALSTSFTAPVDVTMTRLIQARLDDIHRALDRAERPAPPE